eukprot:TRINITY_DN2541_c0_g2_i2.p1 TRINITY_DN2541_c0_g2~~TRINITY_DN2541_c0_g2_i2.p1  ORF type:complete len:349 (+),score=110.33 TRINITY_DN2541_c0_g2_i2:643-1689(+)
MDCFESAAMGQPEDDTYRLLHFVVVGGGPTGVEYAAELSDFIRNDLKRWFPEVRGRVKITLIESQQHLLSSFNPDLVQYTEQTFSELGIEMLTGCSVKEVKEKEIVIETQKEKGVERQIVPYGLLVWATGITARPLILKLAKSINSPQQSSKRGLVVDKYLRVVGAQSSIFAIGDCAVSGFPPTAQVANQQGFYIADVLNNEAKLLEKSRATAALQAGPTKTTETAPEKTTETTPAKTTETTPGKTTTTNVATTTSTTTPENTPKTPGSENATVSEIPPFVYVHKGSLAYVGDDRAIVDLKGHLFAGQLSNVLWRSAYLAMMFSPRNKFLVLLDWGKTLLFGRDISRL